MTDTHGVTRSRTPIPTPPSPMPKNDATTFAPSCARTRTTTSRMFDKIGASSPSRRRSTVGGAVWPGLVWRTRALELGLAVSDHRNSGLGANRSRAVSVIWPPMRWRGLPRSKARWNCGASNLPQPSKAIRTRSMLSTRRRIAGGQYRRHPRRGRRVGRRRPCDRVDRPCDLDRRQMVAGRCGQLGAWNALFRLAERSHRAIWPARRKSISARSSWR